MKIKIFAITLLLGLTKTTFAQKTYYHKNTFDKTFVKCDSPPSFGADTLDLQKYLSAQLRGEIPKTIGLIKVSILIDTTGKGLCEWIANDSNLKIKKVKLSEVIDTMPNWNCGVQNKHKVDCVELVVLTFNKQDLEVTYKIGYD